MPRRRVIGSSAVAWAALTVLAGSQQVDPRVERIHQKWVFADTHAHPSRFHRANVPRIMDDELGRYRSSLVDVVVANVSSDAIYSGSYDLQDGTRIPPRQHHPAPGEPFAFTLDRFERILRTVEAGRAVLGSSPAVVLEAKAGVCIGSDLRGMSSYTEGFGADAKFLAIADGLLAAGYSEDEVGKVMGGNFMTLWARVARKP